MYIRHLRAKAMILAFLVGAPIPPNAIAAGIVVNMNINFKFKD